MSLISDALKRAQKNAAASETPPTETPPAVPSSPLHSTTTLRLKHAEAESRTSSQPPPPVVTEKPVAVTAVVKAKSSGIGVVIGLLIVVLAAGGAAGFFGWKFYQGRKANAQETVEGAVKQMISTPIQRTRDVVKKVQENQVIGAPGAKTVDVMPSAPAPTVPKTVVRSGPARSVPVLQLQGVTIHGGLREAMINGQSVRVGDEVEGAKVLEIFADRVKLVFDGQEVVAKLF